MRDQCVGIYDLIVQLRLNLGIEIKEVVGLQMDLKSDLLNVCDGKAPNSGIPYTSTKSTAIISYCSRVTSGRRPNQSSKPRTAW